MKRAIYTKLQDWKAFEARKPLLLMGARQTGKSWILRHFGENEFDNCIVVDFEQESDVACEIAETIHKHGLHARNILAAAGIDGTTKRLDNTLIIFDEIQRNPRAFSALKYICQDCPEAHVVASGSLMGLALKTGTRTPVGYVDVQRMLPMTFYEFLEAAGEEELTESIAQQDWASYSRFASVFEERLAQYLIVGGMPEAVAAFVRYGNLAKARKVQNQILAIYEQDFNMHSESVEFTEKIRFAWEVACHLAGKRNEERIFYQKMPSKRAADYYAAVRWLEDCGLIHLCYRASEAQGVLGANTDFKNLNSIKVFLLDIGLRLAACHVPAELLHGNEISSTKGEIIEQFVYQQLIFESYAREIAKPAYYSWQHHGKSYEIDFMIPDGFSTVPVEVKSSDNVKSASLKAFQQQFAPEKMVRFSPKEPQCQAQVWSLPLGMCQSVYTFLEETWDMSQNPETYPTMSPQ